VSVLTTVRRLAQDYAYVGDRQIRSFLSSARPADYRTGTERDVVVLPGIYENWRFMQPLIRAVHDAGHPVHVLPTLHYNRRPVEHAAKLVSRYLAEYDLWDTVIVAHSKGGLIGKYAMSKTPAARVTRLVAICSPFSGSRYARFALAPSLRAFSPNHATTRGLIRENDVNQRITSVFGTFDPMIPDGSELPGARNIRLDVAGHFRILSDPATIETVLLEVAGYPTTPPSSSPNR
jgi:pimeloyl-ACP methyl ester carboxylesterase